MEKITDIKDGIKSTKFFKEKLINPIEDDYLLMVSRDNKWIEINCGSEKTFVRLENLISLHLSEEKTNDEEYNMMLINTNCSMNLHFTDLKDAKTVYNAIQDIVFKRNKREDNKK